MQGAIKGSLRVLEGFRVRELSLSYRNRETPVIYYGSLPS